jgi:hypothetical protein
VPPDATGNGVVNESDAADTARPAVKSDTATFLVVALCTSGTTSVPASGVDAPVNAEILKFAMIVS